MNLEYILEAKSNKGYSCVDISSRSGVPLSTVYKILQGRTDNPRYETIAAIEKVLGIYKGDEEKKDPQDLTINKPKRGSRFDGYGVLREDTPYNVDGTSAKNYKKQGDYTVRDLDELPDYYRFEIIKGKIYDDLGIEGMAGPGAAHQIISGEIQMQLYNIIASGNGRCRLFNAPMDVQLDKDAEKDVYQPDLFIVCDRSKIHPTKILGAPDFIIEILSPSTAKKDSLIKGERYKALGVREYWMIDPDGRVISVQHFEIDAGTKYYTFKDTVPIGIYDGKCGVDFTKVAAALDDLAEELELDSDDFITDSDC